MLRYTKLTVADEIENALSYYHATFLREIPQALRASSRRRAGHDGIAPFLRMGHWIGGDRDGNPNVTRRHAGDTRCAARAELALRHYLTEVHELGAELSMSAAPGRRVAPEMQALAERTPDHNEHRDGRALPARADRRVRAPGGHAARR